MSAVTELSGALSLPDRADLARCEQAIEAGLTAFVEVGTALTEIRDRRLYREQHGTFESYLADRWKISRQQGYRLISAASVAMGLSPMGDIPTERVARALASVPEQERAETWAAAQSVAAAEDRQVAAADVARVWQFRAQPLLQAESDEWFTPADVIAIARSVLGAIDLDPASNEIANRNVRAGRYYTAQDDGLAQPWFGRVWCNPPYSLAGQFAAHAIEHYQSDTIEAAILCLSSGALTAHWFKPMFDFVLCISAGRLRFLRPDGTPSSNNTVGSALVYLGRNRERFAELCAPLGAIVARWPS